MHKHKGHESQCEYRFAFSTRANVFDFENVECFVVEKDFQWPRLILNTQSHWIKLRLGNLEDSVASSSEDNPQIRACSKATTSCQTAGQRRKLDAQGNTENRSTLQK
jgi:hypothetical protein